MMLNGEGKRRGKIRPRVFERREREGLKEKKLGRYVDEKKIIGKKRREGKHTIWKLEKN